MTPYPVVTRLRVGRIAFLGITAVTLLGGGMLWLLTTQAKPVVAAATDSAVWPAWMRTAQTYPAAEPEAVKPQAPAPDPNAALLARFNQIAADLERQRLEIEALKKRPTGTTIVQPAAAAAAKSVPTAKLPPPMLYVSHEVKDGGPKPLQTEFTLAPGATKLPCEIETVMNSDVEGYFTAKVSTNIYDTATGRHLLVPQGSTILGHDQSDSLLYGNERLPTISLTLTLPDGRPVELGRAPVTDQQGVAGLTGDVNNHYGRLLGAVFIGGALRGGQQALQTSVAQAGGVGQVASGISAVGSQAGQQRVGRALDTRPTILVASGQLCNVLLLKALHLPALWQGDTADSR